MKPGDPGATAMNNRFSPDRFTLINYALISLIEDAYYLREYQILNAPAWLRSERWPCGFMRHNLLKRWDRGRQLRRPRLFRHLGRSSLAEARGLATVANVSANMQHIGSGAIAFGLVSNACIRR